MNQPQAGETYRDELGRELEISAVDPKNRQARQVQGTVRWRKGGSGSAGRPYACDFTVFSYVWKEKVDSKPD